MRYTLITLYLLAVSLGCCAADVENAAHTVPQETATHFCRLLVCNSEENVCPLYSMVHSRQVATGDSLTSEQLFAEYVFRFEGWKTLRVFPHREGERIVWYAAHDQLPTTMDAEHQKYIREVFPRILSEMQAGNWPTVDAYIDRITQYQCTFAAAPSVKHSAQPVGWCIGLLMTFCALVSLSYINNVRKQYEKDHCNGGTCMPRGQGDSCRV